MGIKQKKTFLYINFSQNSTFQTDTIIKSKVKKCTKSILTYCAPTSFALCLFPLCQENGHCDTLSIKISLLLLHITPKKPVEL